MHRIKVAFLMIAAGCAADAPGPRPSPPAASPRAAAPAVAQTTITRRVVVSLTRKSGTDVATLAPDGTLSIALDVLVNGRGPSTDATIRLARDGTIASFQARGHHEMGTPVDETFAREGDHVRWKSHEESGERDLLGGAFYVPGCALPDVLGLLAQALLRAGGPLPLLPGGVARIATTTETTVRAGASQRRLRGYAISGLDLVPQHVWMNDDGTWFGYVSPWFSVVPEGWESAIEPLIAEQVAFDRTRDQTFAETAPRRPPEAGLALLHARVLDVEKGRWLPDQTVVVVGDEIRSVGPSAKAKVPLGAEVMDLGGKAVIPGLWDMHAHLGDGDGALNLASGVTTVRDVGNDPDRLDERKRSFDDGTAVGPRVLRFGFIEGRNEKAASSKVTAETEDEARQAVEFFAARKYEGIKIYNSVRPELVPLLAREAHARGMAVSGHIPVHMLAHEAVAAGYDGIEHINMLFLNFFADHDTDTRTTLRFTLVGDRAANFDLGSKPVSEFLALLKKHRTLVDPTLGAFEGLLFAEPGKVTPGLERMVERLPVQAQRGFLRGGLPIEAEKRATYRASFAKLLDMVARLRREKIPLLAGTDGLAGLMLHHELALFVRAGISPADALRIATIESARAMKLDKQFGTIAAGKVADLAVIDGDPLARIEDLARVEGTIKGGVVYDSVWLYESVGVAARSR